MMARGRQVKPPGRECTRPRACPYLPGACPAGTHQGALGRDNVGDVNGRGPMTPLARPGLRWPWEVAVGFYRCAALVSVTAAVPVVAVAVGFAGSKFTRSWSADPDGSALPRSLAAVGEWPWPHYGRPSPPVWPSLSSAGPSAMRCALGAVGGSACRSWRRTAPAR